MTRKQTQETNQESNYLFYFCMQSLFNVVQVLSIFIPDDFPSSATLKERMLIPCMTWNESDDDAGYRKRVDKVVIGGPLKVSGVRSEMVG